jgi:hypothetical protein
MDRKSMAPLLVPSNVDLYNNIFTTLAIYTMSNIGANVLENFKMINIFTAAR